MTILDVDGLYAALEVDVTASPESIRTAYRQQSKKWHPDVNKDVTAPERMAKINEAFFILSDPVRRYEYDRKTPPPPIVTCSSYDILLNNKNKKVVITVSSSAPINSVDIPTPFGLGWSATVRLSNHNTLLISVLLDPNGTSGVSFLDFTIDGVAQSVRVETAPHKRTAQHKTTTKQRMKPVAIGISLVQSLVYIACIGGMGFLSGFIGRSAIEFDDALELRDTQASLSILYVLISVVLVSAIALFWTNVVLPRWSVGDSLVQTLGIASFIVLLNIAWPTAVAVLLLIGFVYRAFKSWVRL